MNACLSAGNRREERHFVMIGNRRAKVAIDAVDGNAHSVKICQCRAVAGRLFGDMRDERANRVNAVWKLQFFG